MRRRSTSRTILRSFLVLVTGSKFEGGKGSSKSNEKECLAAGIDEQKVRKEGRGFHDRLVAGKPTLRWLSLAESKKMDGREEIRENDWRGEKSEECKKQRRIFFGHINQLSM